MYEFVVPSLVAALGWGVSPFLENVVVKKIE